MDEVLILDSVGLYTPILSPFYRLPTSVGSNMALHRERLEGFTVTVPNNADMYVWHVAIFGNPIRIY